MSKQRDVAAMTILKLIWPIEYPVGRSFTDEVMQRALRDALILANEYVRLSELPLSELQKVGVPQPPPEAPKAEQMKASDAVVDVPLEREVTA